MFAVSTLLGVLAYASYKRTDQSLKTTQQDMRRRGRALSVEGCVDAVISWRERCLYSRVLCNSYAPRVMRACLEGRDRRAYCDDLLGDTYGPRFGYRDCQRRKVTHKTKKACAAAYRMIHVFCRGGRRGS